jgi:hypothetical protein
VNYSKVPADSDGNYSLIWNFTTDGTYYIAASYGGSVTNSGADSETLAVFIGPESLLQFQNGRYNNIIGQPIDDYAIRPYGGVNDFLDVPLGTNVSLSYDFAVFPTGHLASNVETENVTLPAFERVVRTGYRQTERILEPARTIPVPINIPLGMEPLRLADDFNQTINNKFSFIVRNGQDSNYSLNVKGLSDYAVSGIKQENGSNTAFLNATDNIEQGAWYRVTTIISERGITANIQTANGTTVDNTCTPYNRTNSNQLVLLIANNIDNAIAMKNLKIQTTSNPIQPTETPQQAPNNPPPGIQCAYLMVVLAVSFAAAAVYVKKKKKPAKS